MFSPKSQTFYLASFIGGIWWTAVLIRLTVIGGIWGHECVDSPVMNSSWGSQFNLIEKQGPGAVWVLVFIPTILPLWPWSLDSKPYSQALIISFPNLHDGIRHPTALPQKPVSMVNSVFPSTGQQHSENPNLTSATHKLPGCPGQVSSCPGVIFPNQECKVVSLSLRFLSLL